MDWKEELEILLDDICTDSDVMDFIDEHPKVSPRDIWNYVYEHDAPDCCKGCKYIQYSGMHPCTQCSRKVELKDYYVSR